MGAEETAWGCRQSGMSLKGRTSGKLPLTHQVDTKVNSGKQKAQEESEGHDTCGGACSSPSHSTGAHQPQGQQHNPSTSEPGKWGGLLVTQTPWKRRCQMGPSCHFKA